MSLTGNEFVSSVEVRLGFVPARKVGTYPLLVTSTSQDIVPSSCGRKASRPGPDPPRFGAEGRRDEDGASEEGDERGRAARALAREAKVGASERNHASEGNFKTPRSFGLAGAA
jgi:hypothetical protein